MLTSLVAIPLLALTLAFQSAPAGAAAQGGPDSGVAATPANPNLWPQEIQTNGKTYVVYQPVVTGIDGSRAYLVTQVTMQSAGGAPITGKAALQADLFPSDIPGELEMNGFRVASFTVNGQPASSADIAALGQALWVVAITIDRASLVQQMHIMNARGSSTPGLSTAAPDVVVMQQATVLVQLTGEPVLAPIGSGGWKVVRNTPSILLQGADGSGWARVAGTWYTARMLTGRYAPAADAPPADVVAALGKPPALPPEMQAAQKTVAAPKSMKASVAVLVATRPTVLVATDGAPTVVDAAPGVSAIGNTPATVLSPDAGKTWYVYASGRWFRSTDLAKGPWTCVDPIDVPRTFAKLPSTKRWDGVRASIPGTPEANEAALAAREVRTVTVNRNGPQCKLSFVSGKAPSWQPAAKGVQYATNASQPLFRTSSGFYCCDSGVWFVSPAGQTGPVSWSVCDKVPTEIYAVPPTCPAYPATYVEVYGATADSVTFGYTAGYFGTYLNDGTPVFGTGHPMTGATGDDGQYLAYPQTYGSDAQYDAQTGTFMPPDDPNDDYAYYGWPDVNPMWMDSPYGWTGWGWCPGWNNAWATGWGNWWGWDHWGWWSNHWNPYYNRWSDSHHAWQQQTARDAAARTAQRNVPADQRTWPAARGDMAKAARPQGTAAQRTAAENEQALRAQYQGAAGDAPVAFRGPGDEYGGYSRDAYRPWTGTGSNLGGNWGYSPLARPNGFAPPQQFAAPGAYWGSGTAAGNNVGPNAGPYTTPQGHGGWGSYDHWAGEGLGDSRYTGDRR